MVGCRGESSGAKNLQIFSNFCQKNWQNLLYFLLKFGLFCPKIDLNLAYFVQKLAQIWPILSKNWLKKLCAPDFSSRCRGP